jgi:hypothetical protein
MADNYREIDAFKIPETATTRMELAAALQVGAELQRYQDIPVLRAAEPGLRSPLGNLTITNGLMEAAALPPDAQKVEQNILQALLSGNGDNIDKVIGQIDQFNDNPALQRLILQAINDDPRVAALGINVAMSADNQRMWISGGGAGVDGSYDWGGNWKKYELTALEMLTGNDGGGGGGGDGGGGGW